MATLTAALELLASRADVRAEMGANAAALARREHDVERVADLYVGALERVAGGAAVDDAVLREVSRGRGGRRDLGGDGRGERDRPAPRRGRPWVALYAESRPGRGSPRSSPARRSLRAILVRGIVAPFIFVDEIIWSELARGIADAGEPLLRDQPDPGYSVVYPLLISPAYALFDGLPDAYAAVKTENAVLMSLAAVPAFFLARRVVRDGLALLAALLAVAVPSLAYTGTVMTENAFYPLFLARRARARRRARTTRRALWVDRSSSRSPVLAFATRVQAVALGPAILLAPLVLAIFEPRGLRSTVSRFRWLYGLVVGLAVAVLVVQLVLGRTPQDLLGAYSPVGDRSYDVGDALRYLWWHVAELALYVLVIPLAATIVLVARARSLDARLQAFLAATVALTVCIVPMVAVFASEFSARIEERNMFYVAPLLCIALLAWVERRRAAAPVARDDRCGRVRAPRRRDPVRPLPHDVGDHRHAHAAPALVAAGSNRRELGPARRSRARRCARGGVPLRARALRARASAARPRSLDPRGQADLVREARIRAILARRARSRGSGPSIGTGSIRSSRAARAPPSSGPGAPTGSP